MTTDQSVVFVVDFFQRYHTSFQQGLPCETDVEVICVPWLKGIGIKINSKTAGLNLTIIISMVFFSRIIFQFLTLFGYSVNNFSI